MSKELITVKYSTNNSGGSYWLNESDWKALQDAGWLIMDWDNAVYDSTGHYLADENGLPTTSKPADLDTAHYAYKKFKSIKDAIEEFEQLTGEDVSAEGCSCCGPPHSFTWGRDIIVRNPVNEQDYHYASGEDLLEYMMDVNTTLSKRQLLEKILGGSDD